jgi:hypothetical protein
LRVAPSLVCVLSCLLLLIGCSPAPDAAAPAMNASETSLGPILLRSAISAGLDEPGLVGLERGDVGTALHAVKMFQAAGLPIDEVYVHTEETSPLLGLPAQYIEKVVWHDTRLVRSALDRPMLLDSGGSIERFRNQEELRSRLSLVEAFDGTAISAEDYRFEIGLMLLRLPLALTPAQGEEYRAALAGG